MSAPCIVLHINCLHHVMHLQTQPVPGEHKLGKPWKALLLPPGETSSGSSSCVAAGFSNQVFVERAVNCHHGERPAKKG